MFSIKNEEIPSLRNKVIKMPDIPCGQQGSNNRIQMICINKNCLFNAFYCKDEQCQKCKAYNHKDCSFTTLQQLADKAEEELNRHGNILGRMFEIQERLMRQFKQSRENLIKAMEQIDNQKVQNMITVIFEKKNIKGITGRKMSELFSSLSQLAPQRLQKNKLQKQMDSYKNEGEKILADLLKLRQNIFDSFLVKKKILCDSKLLTKEQQTYLLKQLDNPSQLKLLFCASQHNFSAAKFHKYCDDFSDTVTIVRTEFGKTIAGYTPLKWGVVKNNWIPDHSKSSFLLQLDLKQKMSLIQPQFAIFNHQDYGPVFGHGHDLWICDQCNQKSNSGSDLPSSYSNGKYKRNQESFTAFSGSPYSYRFRVAEYEVFGCLK